MPYLFAFLVGANALYLGYQIIQEQEPTALQQVTPMSHKDFPVTVKLVSEHPLFHRH